MEFQLIPHTQLGVGANPDFNTDILRYGYSSMTTPASTYDYNMSTHERELKKQQEVVGGHNPQDYTKRTLICNSSGWNESAVSLVYKKGTKLDGTRAIFALCVWIIWRNHGCRILFYASFLTQSRISYMPLHISVVVRKWVAIGMKMVNF
jgi:hypothetical protein